MKLLIIRFSSIGDIVLCTPVIRACKEQLNAEIHLLTKASYKDLLSGYDHIDTIHAFQTDPKEIINSLIAENYDLVIDFQRNIRSIRLRKSLKVKSFTFPKLNVKKWITVQTKINVLPDLHVVDRYFKAVKSLGVINDKKGLDFPIKEGLNAKTDTIIQNIPGSIFIVLVLGATYYTKRIPFNICEEIIQQVKYPIITVGGPDESHIGQRLAEQFSNVMNTCGELSIKESAAIIAASQLVITGDTGMMHIAAALKKKTIVIWGNTIPEFGMEPYLTDHLNFQVKDINCRPCSKLGFHECPKGHFKCMNNQNADLISSEIIKLIDS